MLINTENGLVLSNTKVIFEENGVQKEKIVGNEGKEWWLKLENKHQSKNIISFEEKTYDQEVLARLEEVKDLNIDLGLAERYVLENEEIEGILKLKVENQEQVIADLTKILIDKGLIY